MYPVLKQIHSFTAYQALGILTFTVVYASYRWFTTKPFTKQSKIITLIALISAHLQLLFGFILYFLSPLGLSNFSGEAMKNSMSRLYILEHPLMMLIAIGLITYGYSKAKRITNDKQKFIKIALFYGLGLIAILTRIPWSVWL